MIVFMIHGFCQQTVCITQCYPKFIVIILCVCIVYFRQTIISIIFKTYIIRRKCDTGCKSLLIQHDCAFFNLSVTTCSIMINPPVLNADFIGYRIVESNRFSIFEICLTRIGPVLSYTFGNSS